MEWAFLLDGKGGATRLDEEQLAAWKPADGLLWAHFDYSASATEAWLQETSGVPELYQDSLTDEAPRPRVLAVQDHLLVVLRGINRNAGHDPEDMVALRMWLGADRLVTLRHRPVATMTALEASVEAGNGPRDPGDFLARIVEGMLERIGDAVQDIVDRVDSYEERVLEEISPELRASVGSARREAIALRRHVAPQRDAIFRLTSERVTWLTEFDRATLREQADRATRIVEDLDAARDRSMLIQEQVANAISEQMNRIMYFLSVVTAVFLPLGLITGLLGINVGGMPGVDSPWAFTIVSMLLVILAIFLSLLFRWFRLV